MAMDNISEGRELRYMFAEESTFGTPIGNSSTFKEALVEHFDVTRDVRTYELPGPHGTTGKLDSDMLMITSGSMASFSTSGPATIYNVHEWAFAYFQNAFGDESGYYGFNTASGSLTPDFTADEGHFLTWVQLFPDPASDTAHLSHVYTSCIASSFKLSVEEDGYWNVENNWVSRGAGTIDNDTSGATITQAEGPTRNFGVLDFWDTNGAEIDLLDDDTYTSVVLHKFDMELTQNVVKEGPTTTGKTFTHYALLDRHQGTFNLEILKDTTSESAAAKYTVGSPIKVRVFVGDKFASTIGSMSCTVRGKITGVTYPKDGKVRAALTCEILKKTAAGSSVDFRVNNGLTEGW